MKQLFSLSALLLAFFIGFLLLGGVAPTLPVEAGAQDKLSGWAWAADDTNGNGVYDVGVDGGVGWISFNCTTNVEVDPVTLIITIGTCSSIDYGVTVDGATGVLSGYAWSDNIAWISFDESDLVGCPSGPCKAELVNNKLSGWARALLGGTSQSGGWDGFINLSGIADDGSSYGIDLIGTDFGGFAWGGNDVVGWINFNPSFGGFGGAGDGGGGGGGGDGGGGDGVKFEAETPTVVLTGNPPQVEKGENATLTWTVSNVNSCEGTGGTPDWSGTKSVPSGSQIVGPINNTTVYTLSCTGINGPAERSVTIGILQPDFFLTKSNDFDITFVGSSGPSTSNTTTVGVIPQYGFDKEINLSATPSTLGGVSATYNFSGTKLKKNEYSTGVTFSVTVSDPIPEGSYTITVRGEGDGNVRTVNVLLNAETFQPKLIEI